MSASLGEWLLQLFLIYADSEKYVWIKVCLIKYYIIVPNTTIFHKSTHLAGLGFRLCQNDNNFLTTEPILCLKLSLDRTIQGFGSPGGDS